MIMYWNPKTYHLKPGSIINEAYEKESYLGAYDDKLLQYRERREGWPPGI
jgi:hypothetical protein